MVSLTESINPSPSPDTLSILTMHPTFLMSDVSDHIPTIGSYLNCLIRLDHCQPDDFPDMVTDTRRTKVCPLEKYWSAWSRNPDVLKHQLDKKLKAQKSLNLMFRGIEKLKDKKRGDLLCLNQWLASECFLTLSVLNYLEVDEEKDEERARS